MSGLHPAPPGPIGTLFLLLRAARRRARGRRRRQWELSNSRARRRPSRLRGLGTAVSLAIALLTAAAAAFVVQGAVPAGERLAAEQRGLLPADRWFIERVRDAEAAGQAAGIWPASAGAALRDALDREAPGAGADGRVSMRQALQEAAETRGAAAFAPRDEAVPGLAGAKLAGLGPTGLPAMLGSLALLAWFAGLVCSGEGLELDVGRRRHPTWEWLFSHPVRPGAVFAAEMLAPLAANPAYWSAPVVPAVLYGETYGIWHGVLAAGLVGIPVTVAAACAGKAVEVAVNLRAAARSRGAMIGLLTWIGYATSAAAILVAAALDGVARAVAHVLGPLAGLPWPWLGWFLGVRTAGGASFWLGVAACWAVSLAIVAAAVASSAWSTARGLAGKTGRRDVAPPRPARFEGRNALLRKELAWFARDRSALVQVILVPATMVGLQLFNVRGLLAQAHTGWQFPCGAGILVGTYFLAIIGPRSLTSEGGTLWLAMTWPHGMEGLLRAKARLWAGLASLPAAGAMAYAAWSFPSDWWKVALVALGWPVFARSMAAKAVTLAQVTPESGEAEKVPAGRRWAVQLGTFAFVGGVLTRQAGPAISGIAFSVVTASAMWQGFRARLPFLLDPWSERLPDPPTLTHAMVAVSALVELGAVLNGLVAALAGRQAAQAGFAVSYGIAAAVVSVAAAVFLRRRGVALADLWTWTEGGTRRTGAWQRFRAWAASLGTGIGAGLGLGVLACAYLSLLDHLPWTAGVSHPIQTLAALNPHVRLLFLGVTVLLAPVAEEFLFRGLLFRTLNREWPGWRAVGGSAVFFASYHPVASWLPVCAVGAACALLFKRTGRLAAAVVLHATCNAVMLSWELAG